MKPLNEKERNRHFLIFLGYFLVTIVLVVCLVYFNAIFNPRYQNELLRKKNMQLIQGQTDNQDYLNKLDSAMNALNLMQKALGESGFELKKVQASRRIGQFSDKLMETGIDSTHILFRYNTLLTSCFESLNDLNKKYELQSQLAVKETEIAALEKKLKEANEQLGDYGNN